MLVVAMAFGWCVISAQTAERAHVTRPEAPGSRVPRPRVRLSRRLPSKGRERPFAAPFRPRHRGREDPREPAHGSEHVEEIDGQRYVFVLERHFHPQGFVGAPNGWHKGVTAYELH